MDEDEEMQEDERIIDGKLSDDGDAIESMPLYGSRNPRSAKKRKGLHIQAKATPKRVPSDIGYATHYSRRPSTAMEEASDEETMSTEAVFSGGGQQVEHPEKTWEEYQDEIAAEARELEAIANKPMTRVPTNDQDLPRSQRQNVRVHIKQELEDAEDDIVSSMDTSNHDNEYLPVFIKQSIEDEDVKPTVDEMQGDDVMEENTASVPSQLQEIDAATFASSRLRRDERDVMEELLGMDIKRPVRGARSVAPRDFSSQRLSGNSFVPRYKSRTVTRSQYKKHLEENYNPDAVSGEKAVQREVLSKRRRQRVSGGKVAKAMCGGKSVFNLAVDAKMLV